MRCLFNNGEPFVSSLSFFGPPSPLCLSCPLCFSFSVIYERFCGSDPNSKDNSVGLQLLAIVLANSLPAYEASCGVDYDR